VDTATWMLYVPEKAVETFGAWMPRKTSPDVVR
jgi:hypothetical protein